MPFEEIDELLEPGFSIPGFVDLAFVVGYLEVRRAILRGWTFEESIVGQIEENCR
jgi:hypothetical protein